MTGAVDTDIILRCRIDKLTGDSGEADVEERRSCSVGIALAGIGEKTSQNSEDRWSGCFVDHL